LIRLKIEALLEGWGGGFKGNHNAYYDIISVQNLLVSWQEFLCGKRKRKDIAEFSLYLTDNIFTLHKELTDRTYRHGPYQAFKINDPRPRDIHKASVRDRLLHHAIYRILYPYFDNKFIFDSFSCRIDKGTHRAIDQFRKYGRIVSRNHSRTAWVLKCDIRKFFASIDHDILKDILRHNIVSIDTMWLLGETIDSFHTENKFGKGLPLGNLTSQLFANIYMNGLDQFVKRTLKIKHYIRYADDFVIFHKSRVYLENLIPKISKFMDIELKLSLHPDKVSIKTIASGVDFLGWVSFQHHRVLRTSTRRRMFNKLGHELTEKSSASYLGLLSHGNAYELSKRIKIEFRHNQNRY